MSAAVELLAELRAAGCTLVADGDKLRIRAESGPVPEALVAKLRPHKAELRALLQAAPADIALDTVPVDTKTDAIGWRLYSRALERELWLARDQRAAEELWAETKIPTLTLEEWPLLDGQQLDVVRVVLDVRSKFGPAAVIQAIRKQEAR